MGGGCRAIYGQKVRSIACAEAKGWGWVSQAGGAASQDLGCTIGLFSEMTGQHWIPHLTKTSRLWGLESAEGKVWSLPLALGVRFFGEMSNLTLCMAHTCTHVPRHLLVGMGTSQII